MDILLINPGKIRHGYVTEHLGIASLKSYVQSVGFEAESLDMAIEYSSVPGVSSITAFAAATGISLSGGIEISDGSENTALLRMKVRRPRETADNLKKSGYTTFILAEKMYMDGQKIYYTGDLPEESPYFSILYAGK